MPIGPPARDYAAMVDPSSHDDQARPEAIPQLGQVCRLLLRGTPRIGKTTVVARLVEILRERGAAVAGIVTHEVREAGERVGFMVEDLAGARALMAHIGGDAEPLVGRYHVDVAAFEQVAVPALRRATDHATVVIIDELGPMELLSAPFVRTVSDLLEQPVSVVGTVHAGFDSVTDGWKSRPDVELHAVTSANRDALPGLLATRLLASR